MRRASEIEILEKADKSRVAHVLKGGMKRETNKVGKSFED